MKYLSLVKYLPLIVLLALLSRCALVEDGSGEHEGRVEIQPGTIVFYGDTASVSMDADTVAAGASFAVNVSTFGSGSCVEAAGMEVEVQDLEAIVVPLDSVHIPGPGGACTDDLQRYPRTTTVAFDEPGPATIRVRGTGRGPAFEEDEGVAELERRIVVE